MVNKQKMALVFLDELQAQGIDIIDKPSSVTIWNRN
jgi:hypothetical protein